jgi:hypothetical protein
MGENSQVLATAGDIRQYTMQLTVDDVTGWIVGAGVGIPGAAADGTALVTRVTSINGNILTLHDIAQHDALRVAPATYIIGTPGASANKPLELDNNLHLVDQGIGITNLFLCKDVNMLKPYEMNSRTITCPKWSAGPMFFNKGNRTWFHPSTPPQNNNIEIA